MRLFLTILCLIFLTPAAHATFNQAEATQKFFDANASYKEGKYEEAVALYKEIEANGFQSSGLYFNLGNSYFKMEDFGRALLYYERAKRLAPRDADVRYNYNYLRRELNLPEEESSNKILQKILHLLDDYTLDEMILGLSFIVVLMGAFHILGLYLGFKKDDQRTLLVVFIILINILLAASVYKMTLLKDQGISIAEANANFEPREQATVYFKLMTGQPVKIIKIEGDWAKIRRGDGKLGWVKKESIEKI